MTDAENLARLSAEATGGEWLFPKHGCTCFHCGETFTTVGSARDHFGFDPSADPACRIKVGAERGLVMALRKAEAEIADLHALLADESQEAYRLLARTSTRHAAAVQDAEEAGYERGLRDARSGRLVLLPSVEELEDLEDEVTDAISDSFDEEWSARDGARHVIGLLLHKGLLNHLKGTGDA